MFERMCKSALEFERTKGLMIPGLRFEKYRGVQHITQSVFFAQCTAMVFHGLNSLQYCDEGSNKSERASNYATVHGNFSKTLPNCGDLIVNHLMLPMAVLGLVPLFLAGEYCGGNKSRGCEYMQAQYGLPKGQGVAKQLMKALCHAIQVHHDEKCCVSTAENIVCECFRKAVNSDGRFKDLVFFPPTYLCRRW